MGSNKRMKRPGKSKIYRSQIPTRRKLAEEKNWDNLAKNSYVDKLRKLVARFSPFDGKKESNIEFDVKQFAELADQMKLTNELN